MRIKKKILINECIIIMSIARPIPFMYMYNVYEFYKEIMILKFKLFIFFRHDNKSLI